MPLMEDTSCVWSPHHIGLIRKIESVQRRFTKRLHNCRNLKKLWCTAGQTWCG